MSQKMAIHCGSDFTFTRKQFFFFNEQKYFVVEQEQEVTTMSWELYGTLEREQGALQTLLLGSGKHFLLLFSPLFLPLINESRIFTHSWALFGLQGLQKCGKISIFFWRFFFYFFPEIAPYLMLKTFISIKF